VRSSQQAENNEPGSEQGKEDEQVPDDFHRDSFHGCGLLVPRRSTRSTGYPILALGERLGNDPDEAMDC